uniref:RGS domain-containing protein n=1 Tax=Steinernema glaseri TaxID=37863 RepID=A0A1I8AR68_9BILA
MFRIGPSLGMSASNIYLISIRGQTPADPFEWTDIHSEAIPPEGSFDRNQSYSCDRETDTTIHTADACVMAGKVDVRDVACQYEAQALSNDAIQRICNNPKFKSFLAKASEILFVELQKEALLSEYR